MRITVLVHRYLVMQYRASASKIAIALITRYLSKLLQRLHSPVLLTLNLPGWIARDVSFSGIDDLNNIFPLAVSQ